MTQVLKCFMIVPPRTSVRGTCLTTVGRPLLSTGTLSGRSKRTVELQHHQWRVHQLMMQAGSGGIANGIVQQPAAHGSAGVSSPVRKRLARAAKKQSGQRVSFQSGLGTLENGTLRRAHGKMAGAGAYGILAKRILARQEVQMRTAIGRM